MQKAMMKDFLLAQISQETGKADLTQEYLFDQAYAAHRSGAILGAPQRLSVLSFVLRNLSDTECESLFPGEFDLRNSRQPAKLTSEALIKEIRAEGRGEAAESIRVIKERIKDLTGIHFTTFFDLDKWGTLKVVKLLYILKTKNPIRIFSLMEPPDEKGKPSMEVRDAHPLIGNERAANLISDLKALLSLEINPTRLNEIDEAFGQLDAINDIIERLVQSAVSASEGDYDTLIRRLDVLVNQLSVLKAAVVKVPKPVMPLAETLYIHCYAMEFVHLTQGTRFIATELIPKLAVVAVGSELSQLSRAIQGRSQVSTNDLCIPMSDFKGFVRRHEQAICASLTKAMGELVVHTDLETAMPHAEKLIRLWAVFSHTQGVLTVIKDFEVSPLIALAALAAICYELVHPTAYYPYWLGQEFDRGNVLSALNKVDLGSSMTMVPEEHNVFWIRRLQWFQYALVGQQDYLERRQKIEECLITCFEHLAKSYDTTAIIEHIDGCAWLSEQLSQFRN